MLLRTSDKRRNKLSVRSSDTDVVPNMGEHLIGTHADKSKFAKVGMGGEILHRVKCRAQKSEPLVLIRLVVAASISSTNVDALLQAASDERL